jgi:hypothetical protein
MQERRRMRLRERRIISTARSEASYNASRANRFLISVLAVLLPLLSGSANAFDSIVGAELPHGFQRTGRLSGEVISPAASRKLIDEEREVDCVFRSKFRKRLPIDAYNAIMVDTIEGEECEKIRKQIGDTGLGEGVEAELRPDIPLGPERKPEPPLDVEVPEGPFIAPRFDVPASEESSALEENSNLGLQNDPPETFTFFANTELNSPTTGTPYLFGSDTKQEPSVAVNGNAVLYTGNTYALVSDNGGATFKVIDFSTLSPSDPPEVMMRICCDQRVVYERSRDLFIWVLQYDATGGCTGNTDASCTGSNFVRIIFTNTSGLLGAKPRFCSWRWTAQQMGQPTGRWLDFPQISLTDTFLYITANIFTTRMPTPDFRGAAIRETALDSLHDSLATWPACSGFNYGYITDNVAFTPAQGARDTMYWAAVQNKSFVRIYRLPRGADEAALFRRSTSYWNPKKSDANCPDPNGVNWCGQSVGKGTGWVDANRTPGTLGFMWNAAVHDRIGSPWPYVRVVVFNRRSLQEVDEPDIWNSTFAFYYPSVAVTARGDIAGTVFAGGFPRLDAFISDEFTARTGRRWEVFIAARSTASSEEWGDYLDANPHFPSSFTWVGTGFTLNDGKVRPRFLWFGRERDGPLELIP